MEILKGMVISLLRFAATTPPSLTSGVNEYCVGTVLLKLNRTPKWWSQNSVKFMVISEAATVLALLATSLYLKTIVPDHVKKVLTHLSYI